LYKFTALLREYSTQIQGNAQSIDNTCCRDYTWGKMKATMVYKRNIPRYIFKCALSLVIGFFILTGVIFYSTYGVASENIIYSELTHGGIVDWDISPEGQAKLEKWWEEQRTAHHLNEPIVVQFFYWLSDIITGDWGNSYIYHVPVRDLLF
jgi:ABC-type dipeptide/oligopeptide/nickel transport system permease component